MVDRDRVAKLEFEVDSIKGDVGEIKGSVSDINKSNANIEKALVKLSMIAENNQQLGPRVNALEKLVWRAIGGGTTLLTALGVIGAVSKLM